MGAGWRAINFDVDEYREFDPCQSIHFDKNGCFNYMAVSLNGATPKTPQNDHFSRKTHGGWGNPPFLETPISHYSNSPIDESAMVLGDFSRTRPKKAPPPLPP